MIYFKGQTPSRTIFPSRDFCLVQPLTLIPLYPLHPPPPTMYNYRTDKQATVTTETLKEEVSIML